MTQKLEMKKLRFGIKITIMIFPFSPRGEWSHQSFSSKQLSTLHTPAFLHVLNPRYSLSLLIVLRCFSPGCPLRRLPSGVHLNALLEFRSEGILRTCPSHLELLAPTCGSIVLMPDLSVISSLMTIIGQ